MIANGEMLAKVSLLNWFLEPKEIVEALGIALGIAREASPKMNLLRRLRTCVKRERS
jgi:hypothetical protein